jgi:hypothetical protein
MKNNTAIKMNTVIKSNGDVTIELTLADGDVTLEWAYSPSGPDSPYDMTVTVPGPTAGTVAEVRAAGMGVDLWRDVPSEVYDDIHSVVHQLSREIKMDVTDDDKAIIVDALVEAICL